MAIRKKPYSHRARDVNKQYLINAIFSKTQEFFGLSLLLAAACAAPPREKAPVVDLRLCVSTEEEASLYRPLFESAAAVEPRGGRDCDAVVKAATLHAGMIKVTSAYDGSTLADIEGTVDLAPNLVKLALGEGTDGYQRVRAQRKEAGR